MSTEEIWLLYCKYDSHSHCAKQTYTTNLLHISTKITPNATDTSHIIAKYVLETNMPYKCHIYVKYSSYFMCRYQTTMLVYVPYITSMQLAVSPQALAYLNFKLLAYSPEQICLPHYTCISCHTNYVVHI